MKAQKQLKAKEAAKRKKEIESRTYTQKEVIAIITKAANKYGVSADLMIRLAKCESGLNPRAVNNKNKNGSIDRGLFQFNSIHKLNPKTYLIQYIQQS